MIGRGATGRAVRIAALAGLLPAGLAAQPGSPPAPGMPAAQRPDLLREVGIDQQLNEPLPLDLRFRDEAGRDVRLGDYFGEIPVILALVYYGCPMLCSQVLNGLGRALDVLAFDAGREFQVVTVSFDAEETPELAAAAKARQIQRYRRPGAEAGWHFLTGDPGSIEALTEAVGFRYAWDAPNAQFAHGAAIVVVTPAGRLSRYFYGIEYSARDLRLGLVEAAAGRIGSVVDQVLLFCYHYDPATGRYSLIVMNLVRLGGLITLLALGGFLVAAWRRERKAVARDARPADAGGAR